MKQPELGKHIAQIRESKGMTQEELVEKCNINVRTIQRIEAGDVTPRSYTVKAIYAALDMDAERDKFLSYGNDNTKQLLNLLLFSIIGGVIYLLLGFPESFMEYLRVVDEREEVNPTLYLIVKLMSVGSYGLLMWGFRNVARHYELKVLEYSAVAVFSIAALTGLIDCVTIFLPQYDTVDLGIVELILIALGTAFFGAALLMGRNVLGDSAMIAGIFELLVATTLITIVLVLLSLFLSIPALILELVVLYQIRDRIKKETESVLT